MRYRILLVDDEPGILDLLETYLSESYDVYRAQNGVEGEAMFHEVKPHLVVTDIMMPERDGIETVMALRNAAPETKIIAMSAVQNYVHLQTSEALGADMVLTKPFRLDEMQRHVDGLISQVAAG